MNNPYKELSPYIESDAHSFKGRSVEISEMYESFDRHEYLVCHADSGEGKSSIIEAGLIPKMKANCFFPIRIIFKSDEHFKNKDVDFDNVICGIINNEIEKLRGNESLSVDVVFPKRLANSDERKLADWEQEVIDSYAWLRLRYARITVDNLIYTPVLIFDQFEEVFTNPQSQEWTDKFFAWLQELSMDLCPQRIISELEKRVSDDAFPEIETQKHFKAIFSLRSEYVGKLDYWGLQRHYIPLLKNNRYLLRPLTIKGAKEVITQQDGYDGLNAVADEIIDILRKQQRGKNYVMDEASELPCIPAMFLSIICSRAFSMSEEGRMAFMHKLVAEKDEDKETAINSLIESFYEKAVAECGFPSKDMGIIEDVLVNNEGSRQRVSSHADALKAIDFSTKYMEILKDARLIRVIPEYNREDDSVEFVHDALCPIIVKRKELRLAAEAREREEQLLKEQAQKNRKRMMIAAAIGVVIIGVLLFFLWQNNRFLKEQEARNLSEAEKDSISKLNNSLTEQNRINKIQKATLNMQLLVNEEQKDSLNYLLLENEGKTTALNQSLSELRQQLYINKIQNDSLNQQMRINEEQKQSLLQSQNRQEELSLSIHKLIISLSDDIIKKSTSYEGTIHNSEVNDIVSFQKSAVDYAKGVKKMYQNIADKESVSKMSIEELKVTITNCVLRNQHCNNLEQTCIQSALKMFENMGNANSHVYQGVNMVELEKLVGIVQKQAIGDETTTQIVKLIGQKKITEALNLYQQGILNSEIVDRYSTFLSVLNNFYVLSDMRLAEIKNENKQNNNL